MSRRLSVLACLVTTTLMTALTAAPAQAAATYENTDYVALGDSYTSGAGAPDQNGLCLRGSWAYPTQWAAQNHPKSYTNVSCYGATIDTMRLTQLGALNDKTDLVTVTIGGNDAGFGPVVLSCTITSDKGCAAIVDIAHDYVRDVLPGKLDTAYRDIRKHAPNARVVVLGYPVLFDTTSADCGFAGLSIAKREMINAGDNDLNDIIRDRARAAGFTYAEVRTHFDGHGICASNAWINGLTVIPPTNSFHPTQQGYTYGYLPGLVDALS
ncbi:GDSL-like lipase/acylhydrolase family protein [Krasilnikovia cinnamomea]|uniref:GDSL-like lipase/acylhydrolase family protein n=1 Tax=Krasilnikovia cinnamomea TaxID=349313 RepID=A0A4Q7ZEK6_9ACTN|nr:SGNH/GDSL hydrolase family protein [Krasilnikovia cinnamomea]RZU49172.1 GDSL-like lipase/acylhydrolase family protein [Krasilnikovia cinnamomea]